MSNALKQKASSGQLITLMSAHNPLSARLAEEAGFDGIWASGFELSAAYGVPDASLLSLTQHLDMTRAICEQVGSRSSPISIPATAMRSTSACRRRLCAGGRGGGRDRRQDLPEGHQPARRRPAGAGARSRSSRARSRRRATAGCGARPARHRPHRGADRRSRPRRGAAARRGLCRGRRRHVADPFEAEDAGRDRRLHRAPGPARSR